MPARVASRGLAVNRPPARPLHSAAARAGSSPRRRERARSRPRPPHYGQTPELSVRVGMSKIVLAEQAGFGMAETVTGPGEGCCGAVPVAYQRRTRNPQAPQGLASLDPEGRPSRRLGEPGHGQSLGDGMATHQSHRLAR